MVLAPEELAAHLQGVVAFPITPFRREVIIDAGNHYETGTFRWLPARVEIDQQMVAKNDAPKAGAIPWLLVTVTGHKGSGGLETVTTIHRVNTEGGVVDAAKSCDASKSGIESESSYSADYYFYAPRK